MASKITIFIPFAQIECAGWHDVGFRSESDLLPQEDYRKLPEWKLSGKITACHALGLSYSYMPLYGGYYVTHYVVSLEGQKEMVLVPEKNAKYLENGLEMCNFGGTAISSFDQWRKSGKGCRTDGYSYNVVFAYESPTFTKLGNFELNPSLPKPNRKNFVIPWE